MSESAREHRHAAPDHVRIAVLTVSDSRTPENDTGGDAIEELMQKAGHEVKARDLVREDPPLIKAAIERMLANPEVDAVVTTGGTGIAARDSTYEVVSALLDKKLDGFGELFRMLSYGEIGSAAMLSRALAGTSGRKFIAALPGSVNAVRLAVEKLLSTEIAHVVFELRKQGE